MSSEPLQLPLPAFWLSTGTFVTVAYSSTMAVCPQYLLTLPLSKKQMSHTWGMNDAVLRIFLNGSHLNGLPVFHPIIAVHPNAFRETQRTSFEYCFTPPTHWKLSCHGLAIHGSVYPVPRREALKARCFCRSIIWIWLSWNYNTLSWSISDSTFMLDT